MIPTSASSNPSQVSPTNMSEVIVDEEMLRVPLAVIYSIIFIWGLTGNVLALWVFFFVHSKKNSLRVFLINLAFADLLMVTCLPFRIQYHLLHNQWKLWPPLCTVAGYLMYMNMYISIFLLGMISIDRYLKIYGSAGTRRKMRSPTWSVIVCAILWMVAIGLVWPLISKKTVSTKCFEFRMINKEEMWKAHINISILVSFWLVFICLFVSYGRIAYKLLRRSRQRPDLPTAPHYSHVARKSFFILFLFTICFVPFHIVRCFYIKTQITNNVFVNQSSITPNLVDKLNEMSLVLSAVNSCLDPVMYFMLSASIRREVRRFMTSVLRVRNVGEASTANSSTELNSKTERSNAINTNNLNEKENASSCSD